MTARLCDFCGQNKKSAAVSPLKTIYFLNEVRKPENMPGYMFTESPYSTPISRPLAVASLVGKR